MDVLADFSIMNMGPEERDERSRATMREEFDRRMAEIRRQCRRG